MQNRGDVIVSTVVTVRLALYCYQIAAGIFCILEDFEYHSISTSASDPGDKKCSIMAFTV